MKHMGKVVILSTGILLGSTYAPYAELGINTVEAATATVKFAKTSYQTTANLNMRSGAGTNFKSVMTIPKGKTVTSAEKTGSWFKVSYTYKSGGKNVTKTGWVSGSFIKPVAQKAPAVTKLSTTVKVPTTTYQTTTNLNMRTGASTSYKTVLTIPKGKTVTTGEKIGSWNKVTYTYTSKGKKISKSGWVSSSYLKEFYQYSALKGTYFFTKGTAKLHSTPDTKKAAVSSAAANNGLYSTQKVVNSVGETWYRVSFQGKNLFVKSTDVNSLAFTTFAKTDFKAAKDTYVYQSHGNAYTKLVKIPQGAVVSATQRIGDWVKVSYAGKTGYFFSKDFTTFKAPAETKITAGTQLTTSAVYLRQYADTSSLSLGMMPKGTKLVPTHQTSSGWLKVTWNGKTGYVYKTFLQQEAVKETKPVVNFTEEKVAASTHVVTANLNLREAPDSGTAVLVVVPKDTKVVPTHETANGWFKISYSGKSGYVSGKYLTQEDPEVIEPPVVEEPVVVSPPETPTVPAENPSFTEAQIAAADYRVTANLNVRSTPDATIQNVLTQIPVNTIVVPTHKTSNNWFKVTYGGKTGYVSGSYLVAIAPPVVEEPPAAEDKAFTEQAITKATHLITSNLNFRESADSAATSFGVIPQGTFVVPTHKTSNNWYKIVYGGKTGYVFGTYVQQVKTGAPVDSREGYQFIDVRTQSNVTAAQINNYIQLGARGKPSVLTGKGQVFIDAGNKYGVNALFLAAHAVHESGFGTSTISLGKYNLFGFGAFDLAPFVGAYRFESIDANIQYIAQELKATYLNPANWKFKGYHLGYTTKTMSNTRINESSEGMNFYYASDEKWGFKIAQHMTNMLPFDKAYYSKATANTSIPAVPGKPAGGDIFPEISAIAKSSLALVTSKGSTATVRTLTAGTKFTMLEKSNDYWVKLSVDGTVYWTKSISFASYSSYMQVLNLGRVTAASLNIRSGASTSHAIIGSYSLNDYVHLVLKADNTLSMDSSKTWYEVKLPNGTKGWVSAQFVMRELIK